MCQNIGKQLFSFQSSFQTEYRVAKDGREAEELLYTWSESYAKDYTKSTISKSQHIGSKYLMQVM